MKLRTLLLYIGLAIIGFWLLGLAFRLATWAVELALIIGLVLVILSLLNQFYESRKAPKKK